MTIRDAQEFEELLAAVADDKLSAAQEQRLLKLLEDEDARQAYAAYMQTHVLLDWEFAADSKSTISLQHKHSSLRRTLQYFTRSTPFSISVAALVMGLLLTAMAFMAPPFYRAIGWDAAVAEPEPLKVVAHIMEVHQVVQPNQRSTIKAGMRLLNGDRIEIEEGVVELQFKSGAKVALEGPAVLVTSHENGAGLELGKLFAMVPPEASGFFVQTEQATVTDLGTIFGVEIDESGATATDVVKGAVEVQPADAATPVRLSTGQACTVWPQGRQLSRSAANPERFALAAAHLNDDIVTVQVNFRSPNEPTHTAPGWNDVTEMVGAVGALRTPSGAVTDIELEIINGLGWLWPSGGEISQPHRAANGVVFPPAVLTDLGGDNYEFGDRDGISVLRFSSSRQYTYTITLAAAAHRLTEETHCNIGGQWRPDELRFEGGQTVALFPDVDGDSTTIQAASSWDRERGVFVLTVAIADVVRDGKGASGVSAMQIEAVLISETEQ